MNCLMLLFFCPVSESLLDTSACQLEVLGLFFNDLLRSVFTFGEARGDPAGDPFGDTLTGGFWSNVKTLGEVVGFLPLGGLGDALSLIGRLPIMNDPDPT